MEVHVGLQNCSYIQFTTLSLRVFMWVNVRHISISAVKNNYSGGCCVVRISIVLDCRLCILLPSDSEYLPYTNCRRLRRFIQYILLHRHYVGWRWEVNHFYYDYFFLSNMFELEDQ